MGRPTIYTQAMADEICKRLASGNSLRSICEGKPRFDPLVDEDHHSHLPDISTVLSWALNPDHPFSNQYEKARASQAEYFTDEMRDLPEIYPTNTAMARLVADNTKWISSRLLSGRYGDRVTTELVGSEEFGANAAMQFANILSRASKKANDDVSDDDLA